MPPWWLCSLHLAVCVFVSSKARKRNARDIVFYIYLLPTQEFVVAPLATLPPAVGVLFGALAVEEVILSPPHPYRPDDAARLAPPQQQQQQQQQAAAAPARRQR